jgi:hypothetical protein
VNLISICFVTACLLCQSCSVSTFTCNYMRAFLRAQH